MLEKKEVLEVLGGFDVKDLNQVMELLQGKKYVESKGHNVEWSAIMDPLHKATTLVTFGKEYVRMSLNLYFKSNKYESLLDDVNEVKKGVELSNGLLELKEVEFKDWKFLGYVEASVRVVGTFTKEMMKELSKKGVIL